MNAGAGPEGVQTAAAAPPVPYGLMGRGAVWSLLSHGTIQTLHLLRGILLARLLFPEDFGIYALANLVAGLAAVVTNPGAESYVVQKTGSRKSALPACFWTTLIGATFSLVLTLLAAPPVASFYGAEALPQAALLLSAALLLHAIGQVYAGLLRHRLQFGRLALIGTASNLFYLLTALLLAWQGYGFWSIIAGMLAGNLLSLVLMIAATGWMPDSGPSWESCLDVVRFGLLYLGASSVWFFVLNIDNLLVGKYLGTHQLGIYSLAFNYATVATSVIPAVAALVSAPVLASLQKHGLDFQSVFSRATKWTAVFSCGVGSVLLVAAPDLFHLALGPRWEDAVIPFQVLVVCGTLRALFPDLFVPLGRLSAKIWLGLAAAPMVFAGVAAGLAGGLVGVGLGMTLAIGSIQAVSLVILSRLVPLRLRKLLADIGAPLLAGTLAAGLGLAFRYALEPQPPLWTVPAAPALTAVLFLVLTILIMPGFYRELRLILTSVPKQ